MSSFIPDRYPFSVAALPLLPEAAQIQVELTSVEYYISDSKTTAEADPLQTTCIVQRRSTSIRTLPRLRMMPKDVCADCSAETFGLAGKGTHLVVPSLIAPLLALLLVTNRAYWRLRMLGRLGVDDVSTIAAMFFLIVQCASSIAAVNYGYGRPLGELSEYQAVQALKYFFLLQIFYKLTINFTKISILSLYLRIFTEHLWFRRACWGLICLVLGACICFTMATVFQCIPISRAWNRWNGSGTCMNLAALWETNAVYNIMTDFIIVLMVPPVIFQLKLPLRQKLALTGIFGLGVIVCAASICRMTTLYSSANGTDLTAGSFVSTIWTTIEAGLGVVCANLPMLRTPLQHFFPKFFLSRMGTNQISSRGDSRSNWWNDSDTLASPTRLVPPPVQTRNTGLMKHESAVCLPMIPPLPTDVECHNASSRANNHGEEVHERYFGHLPEHGSRTQRTRAWNGQGRDC